MREIKFRGQDITNGMWYYGDLHTQDEYAAIDNGHFVKEVKPETVWQFTGLHDKDNKEIYDDDIVEWQQYGFMGQKTDTIKCVVYFDTDCGAYGLRTDLVEDFSWFRIFYNEVDLGDITVIGNIHDNIELLKKEE